jgi:D-aminoacyl-tRNA deacylase
MKVVVQRVSRAQVTVDNEVVGKIGLGFVVLLGVEKGDSEKDAEIIAKKLAALRIFSDEQGKMNLSIDKVSGQMLVVSQFTLLGDCKKGNRPSFINAASPEEGNRLYECVVRQIRQQGIDVQTGRFQTEMHVELVNTGPVTLIIDSRHL